MRDFSRLGALQAVTYMYTVKVVVGLSKKWREIDTLLLHTTNRYGLSIRAISNEFG